MKRRVWQEVTQLWAEECAGECTEFYLLEGTPVALLM